MGAFQKEPAAIIGLIATIVVLVAQQVLASGIVTSAGGLNLLNLVISVTPVIAGLVIRQFVYSPATVSASAPKQ
jgi:hypothetical protein